MSCLPDEVFLLKEVTDLDLSDNELTVFPFSSAADSKKFVKKLSFLSLSNNRLEMPSSVLSDIASEWYSLRSLDLSENYRLSTQEIETVTRIPNLRNLNLRDIESVCVSSVNYLFNLPNCCEVDLDGTPLLRKFREIQINKGDHSFNPFLIPKFIEKYFLRLKKINLSNRGSEAIYMDKNSRIPAWLTRFSVLESLALRCLKFRVGECQENLWKDLEPLQDLKYLDLADTSLNSIPSSFFDLHKELRELSLAKNPEIELIPANVRNLRNLQILDLRGCKKKLLCKELFDLPTSCVIKFDASIKGDVSEFINRKNIKNSPIIWYFD